MINIPLMKPCMFIYTRILKIYPSDLEISLISLSTIRMYNALYETYFLFVYVRRNYSDVLDRVKGLLTGTWKNLRLSIRVDRLHANATLLVLILTCMH